MNNTASEKQLVDRLIEFGATAPEEIQIEGGRPVVVVPSACQVQSLEKFYPPQRIERAVTLLQADSFADYVNRFKTLDTLIFATVSETGVEFVAMLDYHGPAPELKPAFCSHMAHFAAIETPEWKVWSAADRKAMKQVPFATWIEDNGKLFVEPNGAALLELIRTLHGHNNARFNTALRLDNGAYSVSYDEDRVVKGTSSTTSGEIELPPVIKAGIAVFQGADKYEVSARLKSRIEDRSLNLFFETIAKYDIVRESILLLVKQIATTTGIIPLIGKP